MKWRPIETAPKDNRSILIWPVHDSDHEEKCEIVFWAGDDDGYPGWYWFEAQSSPEWRHQDATHWMPLPQPPETTK